MAKRKDEKSWSNATSTKVPYFGPNYVQSSRRDSPEQVLCSFTADSKVQAV